MPQALSALKPNLTNHDDDGDGKFVVDASDDDNDDGNDDDKDNDDDAEHDDDGLGSGSGRGVRAVPASGAEQSPTTSDALQCTVVTVLHQLHCTELLALYLVQCTTSTAMQCWHSTTPTAMLALYCLNCNAMLSLPVGGVAECLSSKGLLKGYFLPTSLKITFWITLNSLVIKITLYCSALH